MPNNGEYTVVVLFLSELKREKRKAEKKDNLKEVSQIHNCIGELLSKYGLYHQMQIVRSESLLASDKLSSRTNYGQLPIIAHT